MRLGETLTYICAQVALDGTADVAVFTPGRPIVIRRFGYIWNSATTTAPETLDIDLDKRITIGSDTGRTAAQATIAGVAAQAIGDGAYVDLATELTVDADEEIVIQTTAGATAGDGYVFIEYQPLPFVGTGTPGLGDLVDLTA